MSISPGCRTARLAAAIAMAGLGLTACTTSAGNSGNSSPACAAILKFDGHIYTGTSLRTHPPYDETGLIPVSHLREIGTATRPACHDTNTVNTTDKPERVEIARIDNIDPGVAVAEFPRGDVYFKRGAKLPTALTAAPWIHWYKTG